MKSTITLFHSCIPDESKITILGILNSKNDWGQNRNSLDMDITKYFQVIEAKTSQFFLITINVHLKRDLGPLCIIY